MFEGIRICRDNAEEAFSEGSSIIWNLTFRATNSPSLTAITRLRRRQLTSSESDSPQIGAAGGETNKHFSMSMAQCPPPPLLPMFCSLGKNVVMELSCSAALKVFELRQKLRGVAPVMA